MAARRASAHAIPALAGLAILALAGCATRRPSAPDLSAHVPPFARVPYEPFSRDAAVAIARDEWRLFGSRVDDDPPGSRPPPAPEDKAERQEGFWQRVGEYWWLGLPADREETRWTGKHDENGREFPADDDEAFAWSAAFISYVMRIAGAGDRFPYGAAHHVYINAARETSLGRAAWVVAAEPPGSDAPALGDLICMTRAGRTLSFADLPAGRFPAHCDIVVGTPPGALEVIGGNVDDAVTMKHVPVTPDGKLADAGGAILDSRYPWFVVLRVAYDR